MQLCSYARPKLASYRSTGFTWARHGGTFTPHLAHCLCAVHRNAFRAITARKRPQRRLTRWGLCQAHRVSRPKGRSRKAGTIVLPLFLSGAGRCFVDARPRQPSRCTLHPMHEGLVATRAHRRRLHRSTHRRGRGRPGLLLTEDSDQTSRC